MSSSLVYGSLVGEKEYLPKYWRYDFHWGKSNLDITVWWPDLQYPSNHAKVETGSTHRYLPSQCYNNSPIGATKTLGDTRTSTQSQKALVIFGDMRVPASINQDVLNCFDRFMGSVFCFERVRWNSVCWCQSGVTPTLKGCRHMPGCLSPVRVEEGGAWNTGDGAFLTWSRRFFWTHLGRVPMDLTVALRTCVLFSG